MERREYTATGKTVMEALENAKKALEIETTDGFGYKVLDPGKPGGFLGLGAKPAKVWLYEEVEEEAQPATKATAAQPTVTAEPKKAEKPERTEKPAEKRQEKKPEPKAAPATAANKDADGEVPASAAPAVKVADMEENDAALVFVRTVLTDLGINAEASGYIDSDGIKRVTVKGGEATSLIGHHGDTLDALQYLANLAANREYKSSEKNRNRVTVDIEDYREKREETLRALARRMANKALKYRKSVMLEPMNPYERRIIHSEVQNIPGVSTNSIGSENNRKVVIYLTDDKDAPKSSRK